MLAWYRYTLVYRKGVTNANTDALSRLPTGTCAASTYDPCDAVLSVHILEVTAAEPVTTLQIRRWTEKDPILSKVLNHVLSGWPQELDDPALRTYCNRRNELSVLEGCMLWGTRVVVPPQARKQVLKRTTHSTSRELPNKKLSQKLPMVSQLRPDVGAGR